MTIAILTLILLSYILISNEHITNINKAAIATFAGVVGWILFMCTGTDFVLKVHAVDFAAFADTTATYRGINEIAFGFEHNYFHFWL